MKLDKYIKLTDEDIEDLKEYSSEDYEGGLWQMQELVRKLAKQVVVVKPAGEES